MVDDRRRRGAHRAETFRQRLDAISVAHPHTDASVVLGLDPVEEASTSRNQKVRGTILPPLRRDHFAAQEIAHGLHAVADAEHGDASLEQPLVGQRRAFVVDA